MSDPTIARRVDVQIFIEGCDVTKDIRPYLLSVSYTDNEEDESDDLQIKLQDRDGVWRNQWLNDILQAAIANITAPPYSSGNSSSGSSGTSSGGSSGGGSSSGNSTGGSSGCSGSSKYMVTAASGLKARSRPGTQYYVYGTMSYGTVITVQSITDGWAKFKYDGKTAYCAAQHLSRVGSGNTSTGGTPARGSNSGVATSDLSVGDAVIANGRPQYTSYGEGTPGAAVSNYKGTVTKLNRGAPYPICVGTLGWFAESQVVRGDDSYTHYSSSGNKGLRIQAIFVRRNWHSDGKDEILETGQFELDGITDAGPPSTVTIKATSLSYQSSVRMDKRSQSWESIKLSKILKEIASRNGMGYMFLSSEDPKYDRLEQYRQTDIAFLQQICHDAGCSLKCTGNSIVIFDQAENDSKPPVREIAKSAETRYSFSTNDSKAYTSCTIKCTRSNGEVIKATAYADGYDSNSKRNKTLVLHRNVNSYESARKLAYKMLHLHNKFEFQATITVPFDPALCAGCTVKLPSEWGMWAGKYVIKSAQHRYDSGTTTQITLRKAIS